ncbi:alpha-2-macroglobulin-like protein [Plakobranchus ocellatus]|uniref:Alpha-2-macroglobulin-like protein n=1 Tax=Plakobranchus ocellatus TaxID=259542 RepID=A0AAV4CM82_9GAST|nr:alpha-2-macroglobulin-like protein [Plakobranchus ocellatus]
MGAALNNMEYLVRMPTGCGEQNMIGFVSNILVLNYLYGIENLQETTRQAALNNMEIDEDVLERSVDFLAQSQLKTGCFRETGKVFSSYMMGGLGQGWGQRNRRSPQGALTAYVLMALMEAGKDTKDATIELGIQCMNRELSAHKSGLDPYTLALVTSANIKYNSTSPDANFAFKTLH